MSEVLPLTLSLARQSEVGEARADAREKGGRMPDLEAALMTARDQLSHITVFLILVIVEHVCSIVCSNVCSNRVCSLGPCLPMSWVRQGDS